MPVRQKAGITYSQLQIIIKQQTPKKMLHSTDQNQQSSASKTIKLTANLRTEPVVRTLKSTIVSYKDSISHTKNNDTTQNHSSLDSSNQKWEKVIAQQREANNSWNREIENQRQSLLATSREIKRISTEFDQSLHRSNQKSIHLSANKAEFRTPVLRKDQSQYTRTSQNMHNQSLCLQQKSNYQIQIQDLVNKIQYVENQCRNLKSQNDQLHRNMGAPRQILQREVENKNFRIEDVEKRLGLKNKQYLDKCLENQKNLAKVTQLQGIIKKIEGDKQRLTHELQKSNENGVHLSKILNESRASNVKLENQKKKINCQLEEEKLRTTNLLQDKKQLELQIEKIEKIKQLVKDLEQSDSDKAEVIKKHIAYEAQLIELNGVMQSNLESHKHDLKIAADQNQSINKQIESITQQITVKMKDVLEQKQRLEDELAEARAETEKIRKRMFVGYQDIISKLKDQLIQLKEENVNLNNNSESKIQMVKLEREIKILQTKNQDLINRHKQMQAIIERLQAYDVKKTSSEISSQSSIRGTQFYDRAGPANLESIIMSYETRSIDLNQRIYQKELNELQLKKKVEQLEQQLREIKSQDNLSSRKQKTDTENIKSKLESMKMELKAETDSLNRKIEGLQKNIQRKNKEIKEKDNFITQYLIQKVKDQVNVNQIVQEIDKFFIETA